MIDTRTEDPITLPAAAALVPNRSGSRGVNASTVWRWALRGIRGVKLETVLIGGTRYTSAAALHRFFERTTAAADGGQPSTPKQRTRAIEAAERELAEAGI